MSNKKSSGQPSIHRPSTRGHKDNMRKHKVRRIESGSTSELLRAIIEAVPAAIVGLDLEGKVQSIWNPAAEKMFGWTAEEAIGKILPTVPGDKMDEFHEMLEMIKTTKTINGIEVQRRKRDGTPIDYAIYASPLHEPDGEVTGHVAVLVDVTERKRAENAVQDSEERFRVVFDNVFDGISIYDEDIDPAKRRLVDCNEKYAAMAGRSREELLKLGNTLSLQKTLDDSANVNRLLNLSSMAAYHGSFSWIRPDGKENIIEYVGVPIMWRGKSYAIGIDRDVTQKRDAEELLKHSEQKFRMLANCTTSAIFIHQDNKICFVNPACINMTGYTEAELLNMDYWDIVHPDFRVTMKALGQASPAGKDAPSRLEFKILTKSGDTKWMNLTAAPIEYEGKTAILGTANDVTSMKEFEEELRLQSAALNAAANSIVITDRNGVIEWANKSFETLTGYSVVETKGKNPKEIIKSGKQGSEFYKEMWDTILSGKVWHGETVNRRKDNTLYTEEMTITPVLRENDEIRHYIAIKHDITDRKLLESQLLQAQKLDAIGRLAGGVAHDYNNMLGVVIGYSQLIKEKTKPEDPLFRYADLILSSAQRGANLLSSSSHLHGKKTFLLNLSTSIPR